MVAVPASRPKSASRWRQGFALAFRLRPALVTTIVGLVLLTALAIGTSAGVLLVSSTRALIERARSSAVNTATTDVQQYFEVAPGITDELAAQARRGALPLDHPDQLAILLAERLRTEPHLAWIGYGDRASGRYVGATRYDDGEIVEYVADPAAAGGMPTQFAVAADGTRTVPKVRETEPYLVLNKDWFKMGIANPGPAWTDFYKFTSGGFGITCVTRLVAPGAAAPTGVFHADLRLERIADFLDTLQVGERGVVYLADRQGHRLVSPTGKATGTAATAVDMAIAKDALPVFGVPITVKSGAETYEVLFEPIDVRGNLSLDVAVDIDLAEITRGIYREGAIGGGVAVLVTLLATIVGIILSARIARPVAAIAADLANVGAFEISNQPAPKSFVREIANLGDAVDRMKASLRSFGHYVPADLVRTLLATNREAALGGEIRRLTIHFSDIENFTTISEGMGPRDLVAALGKYLEALTDTITGHGGTVDKFIGDGVMAFYNAPVELSDHARQACLAALVEQEQVARLAAERGPDDPVFKTRIGLALGEVLVGNIGTPTRFAYTLLGDEVNLAARLEGLNKVYGTAIMATDAVAADAGEGLEWRRLDRVAVKGRHQGTLVYELLGRRGEVSEDILAARDVYEAALDAYFAGDFESAAEGFESASAALPSDLAAGTMAERSRELAVSPPPIWSGIHVMYEK